MRSFTGIFLLSCLSFGYISAKEQFPCPSGSISTPIGEYFEVVQTRSYPKAVEACKDCGGVLASIEQSQTSLFVSKIQGPVYVDIIDRNEYPYSCLAIFPNGKVDHPPGACAGRIGALCKK
ncbi:hypothetical protein K7432_011786 [Basidiobolus ranarum]|uniref:Uncharacterized protein n=1 Tax=Basidiobolus ranarum TaxID=34480 RepID=A0ABR2WLV8_9FUNG